MAQSSMKMSTAAQVRPKQTDDASKRLKKELKNMQKPPPECRAGLITDDDLFHWSAIIHGPLHSPYAGGVFHLTMDFPRRYPYEAPVVKFKTKVYHPNIDSNTGSVFVNILRDEWSPSMTVQFVLMSIWALLMMPNAEVSGMHEIAAMYRKDPDKYNDIAKQWTRKYAMEK